MHITTELNTGNTYKILGENAWFAWIYFTNSQFRNSICSKSLCTIYLQS